MENSASAEQVISQRKNKIFSFVKEKYQIVSYIVLAIIVFLAIRLRSLNLDRLRDITTNTWTLGPDLDPFLFLRWAQHIVENGKLFVVDMMRYVPLGYETNQELLLHPYMIAWFHKVASIFGSESVTHSAVLYPVFFFAITVIAFFFLVRKTFSDNLGPRKANLIALISSFFLTVLPALLPRTVAGIPEKESAAFFFLFMALYLFLSAWKADKLRNKIILAVLAAISTTAMALIWGGFGYIFLILGITTFISFLLGQVDKNRIYTYATWLILSFLLMNPFSARYSFNNLLGSITTGSAFFVLILILVDLVIHKTKIKRHFERFEKIPRPAVSLITAIILGAVLSSIVFGPSFLVESANVLSANLVKPAESRLIQTVAENRQPFFTEWANSFGPNFLGHPTVFWLFFIGSIYLFSFMIRPAFSKKENTILTIAYTFLLSAVIFSRYSSGSIFNGSNFASLSFYALGFIVFIVAAGYYYNKKYKSSDSLRSIDSGLVLVFSFFLLAIISARGAVRLILVLVPPAAIIVSYFVVAAFSDSRKVKSKNKRLAALVVSVLVILFTIYSAISFYQISDNTARTYAPSVYTGQWQKAMSWVRDNTPQNAVFGHWWDYGYWLQGIGERATVLDGGNAQSYWNHMMGRYALTGSDEREALEFLLAHNTTHFLIDSTDIGKYGAFSSIGSDVTYDRASFIPTLRKDNQRIQETKQGFNFLYSGGVGLDEDIVYELNGERIFLPSGRSALAGVLVELDHAGQALSQPTAIFIYQNQQFNVPLRYAFDSQLKDFNTGLEAGIYIFPRFIQEQQTIDQTGSILYLSKRTINSQLARLYLFEEEGNFRLVHSEDDFVVQDLKNQNAITHDMIDFNGFRGPIKIWEINYPSDIIYKEEYIDTFYPETIAIAR